MDVLVIVEVIEHFGFAVVFPAVGTVATALGYFYCDPIDERKADVRDVSRVPIRAR